jgi:hypothetical protein
MDTATPAPQGFTYTPLNVIAKIISGIIHPMVMPLFGTIVFLQLPKFIVLEQEDQLRTYFYVTMFLCTFLFPSVLIIFLKYTGAIQSISLNNQKDRTVPFIFTGIGYSIALYMINRLPIAPSMFPYNLAKPLVIGATLSVIIALIVNRWFKISIHMMGIGGLTGAAIAIAWCYQLPIFGLIYLFVFLSGITGFARLHLHAHTPAQVYAGFLVSAFCNGGLVWLFSF